ASGPDFIRLPTSLEPQCRNEPARCLLVCRREARVINATENVGRAEGKKSCKQTIKHRTGPAIPTRAEAWWSTCDSCQKASNTALDHLLAGRSGMEWNTHVGGTGRQESASEVAKAGVSCARGGGHEIAWQRRPGGLCGRDKEVSQYCIASVTSCDDTTDATPSRE